MAFFSRSYQEILGSCLEDLATNTNISKLSAGGKARALLEAMARRLEEQYTNFDINLARGFLSSAQGQYLDLIGDLLNVKREEARAAAAGTDTEVVKFYVEDGTFGDINGGADIILEKGRIISTEADGAGIAHKLSAGITLPATASEQYVSVVATVPGSTANVGAGTLVYHDVTNYSDVDNETLLVTNDHPISDGRDIENDTNYRYRIANRVLEAEAANETALRLTALSVPGVSDITVKPRYRGIGTTAVIIQSTAPTVSDALVATVQSKVNSVIAHGDVVYVMGPKETGLTMKLTVHYSKQLTDDELDAIEDELEDAITEYVNGLDIGDSFSVNQLVSKLFSIDENISNLGESGKPIDEIYIYRESRLGDNRVKQLLLGDYTPSDDERVIIETSVSTPVIFERSFVRR